MKRAAALWLGEPTETPRYTTPRTAGNCRAFYVVLTVEIPLCTNKTQEGKNRDTEPFMRRQWKKRRRETTKEWWYIP